MCASPGFAEGGRTYATMVGATTSSVWVRLEKGVPSAAGPVTTALYIGVQPIENTPVA